MPVMDSPEYAGKNQGELLKVAKEKGVKMSVVCPRKTPEFIRAFEMAGGDVASAKVCKLHCLNSVCEKPTHDFLYLKIRCIVGKELCPGRSASGPVERLPAAREASHAASTITGCDTATTDTAAATNASSTAASATAANGKLHHDGIQLHDFET